MTRHYATSPSPFTDDSMTKGDGFRLTTALHSLASEYADAEMAHDEFHRIRAQLAELHQARSTAMAAGDYEAARLMGPVNQLARLHRILARSFVFSVDNFVKQLTIAADDPMAPRGFGQALDALVLAVPGAKDVRDSLHHVEDRMRGVRQGGKPIIPQPISKHGIHAPSGGVMMVGVSIMGSTVVNTAADGSLGEVDVSEATLEALVAALQSALDSVPWYEPSPGFYGDQHWPHDD